MRNVLILEALRARAREKRKVREAQAGETRKLGNPVYLEKKKAKERKQKTILSFMTMVVGMYGGKRHYFLYCENAVCSHDTHQ